VLVVGDLMPDSAGEEAILFLRLPGDAVGQQGFVEAEGPDYRISPALTGSQGVYGPGAAALFAALYEGRFEVAPVTVNALRLDGLADFLLLD
jgi:hypothetical protein